MFFGPFLIRYLFIMAVSAILPAGVMAIKNTCIDREIMEVVYVFK